MNTTIEERRQKSIELMRKLKIYEPYIDGFEKQGYVCYFENYGGFWTWQDEELQSKIKEIEEKHNCTVYAVTHEFTEFRELYDFLIVTDYKEEWEDLVYTQNNNTFCAFAYVWNKSDDWSSEFGNIGINSFGGGIKRVA